MSTDPRSSFRILALCAAVAALARTLWAGSVELSPDEAWYWSWGAAPLTSFRDHPPLLGWILRLVPRALGDLSETFVRLPAIVSAALLMPLVHILALSSGATHRSALLASLAGCFSLMASAGAVIVTPDAPLSVLWTLCLVLSVRLASGSSPWLLAAAGAAAGLALLAKLPAVLLLLGIASAVHARRSEWRRLLAPGVLASALLLASLAPIVLAEIRPSGGPASFQLGRLSALRLEVAGPLLFLASQAGLAGAIPLAGAASLWPLKPLSPASRVLAWTLWPAAAGITLVSAVLHVEPNWGAIMLPSLFAGWALLMDRLSPRRGLALGAAALSLNVALSVLVHLHSAGLIAPSLVGRGPAARLHGWEGLARVISSTSPGPMETSDYSLVAPLAYYGRGRLQIRLSEGGPEPGGEPEVVWSVEERRLGVTRRVEGRSKGSVLTIRASRR